MSHPQTSPEPTTAAQPVPEALAVRWTNDPAPARSDEPAPHVMADPGTGLVTVWDVPGEPTLLTFGLLAAALGEFGRTPERSDTYEDVLRQLTLAAAAQAISAVG